MKRKACLIALVCLMLAMAALLASCGNRLTKIVAEDDDLYRNVKTGSTYQVLPASYEPALRGEEYGRLDIGGVKFILHEIPGLDPGEWLCSAYGDVYCNSSYALPTFEDWDISVLHVCTNTNLVVDTLTVKPSATQPEALCDALFDILQGAYRDASAVYYPSYAEVSRVYTLRFETDKLPGLYFSIKLIEYAEDIMSDEGSLGRTFLYDRYADRCVPVSNIIFRMLDGETLDAVLGEDGADE